MIKTSFPTASIYECEIRIPIKNIDNFYTKLKHLGGKKLFDYKYTDYYYKPIKDLWNPKEKNIRVRVWNKPEHPTKIYYVKVKIIEQGGLMFKKAIYEEGKVPLYEGDKKACEAILKDLGFEPLFTVAKLGSSFWQLPKYKLEIAIENIKQIGWTAELQFDGTNTSTVEKKLNEALKILGVSKNEILPLPVSYYVSKAKE